MKRIKSNFLSSGPIVIMVILFITFSLFIPNFFHSGNLNNILRQAGMLALVAIGQCFVILIGGIDLSQGSVMGFTGVITAILLAQNVPFILGILIGLGIAFALGMINGYLISYVNVPAFVATFGMGGMALGLALVITEGRVVWGFPETIRLLHDTEIFGVSILFLIVGLVYAISFWILRYTRFGTSIYAIGGNKTSAYLSGINVKKNAMLCYGISGCLAGFAGIMLVARMNSARAIMGSGYEFEAIAAVILGGTNRLGGKGGAWETLVGVMIIALVKNGLNLIGVSLYLQLVVLGLVLVIVYIFNQNPITRKNQGRILAGRS